ncbi:hypothetical protein FOWG_02005 [Fusarium oxysporum f. sp. lycopersici MN25]|uniref:Uncharacterized protein n=1 Tax=Fusarium oxysporum Fo47 TaxID=660027 RepID=W9KWY6_FUSOX|nr:hypothetical protein FOZG_05878 [Fusarium oxysporum Fo47]EWZ97570.1 hypothetical protein FOWG_02005 [Fusarium oxysporum f. sp. lycopersici MN25]
MCSFTSRIKYAPLSYTYCSFEVEPIIHMKRILGVRRIPLSTQHAPAPGIIADYRANCLVNHICFSRSIHVRSREPQLSIVFHKDLPCLRMVGVPSLSWLARHEREKRKHEAREVPVGREHDEREEHVCGSLGRA